MACLLNTKGWQLERTNFYNCFLTKSRKFSSYPRWAMRYPIGHACLLATWEDNEISDTELTDYRSAIMIKISDMKSHTKTHHPLVKLLLPHWFGRREAETMPCPPIGAFHFIEIINMTKRIPMLVMNRELNRPANSLAVPIYSDSYPPTMQCKRSFGESTTYPANAPRNYKTITMPGTIFADARQKR